MIIALRADKAKTRIFRLLMGDLSVIRCRTVELLNSRLDAISDLVIGRALSEC